jgi:hypothetical protein
MAQAAEDRFEPAPVTPFIGPQAATVCAEGPSARADLKPSKATKSPYSSKI